VSVRKDRADVYDFQTMKDVCVRRVTTPNDYAVEFVEVPCYCRYLLTNVGDI